MDMFFMFMLPWYIYIYTTAQHLQGYIFKGASSRHLQVHIFKGTSSRVHVYLQGCISKCMGVAMDVPVDVSN